MVVECRTTISVIDHPVWLRYNEMLAYHVCRIDKLESRAEAAAAGGSFDRSLPTIVSGWPAIVPSARANRTEVMGALGFNLQQCQAGLLNRISPKHGLSVSFDSKGARGPWPGMKQWAGQRA